GEGPASARDFAEQAMAALVSALLALTAAALVFMPLLTLALAAGFREDAAKFDLAVEYGRIQFPYLILISLTALFSGVLNAMGRFAAPAAAPMLLNVALIGAMALASAFALPVGDALAWGVLVAGFAQAGLVIAAARAGGMGLTLRRPRLTPGVRRLIRLGIPGAISGGATQINLVIGTLIASFFSGAVAWLSYADRLYQLPLGVVGAAVGVVLLPELSRRVRAGDAAGGREAMNRAAEFSLALTVPAAAALVVFAGPIVAALFQRGAFGDADTRAVALAVALYALGLPAFVLHKVVQPAYFAREDMDAPLRFALVAMALNTALALALAPLIGFAAIPAATSVAAWAQLWLLARGGRSDETLRADARLIHAAPRIAAAAAIMAAALWAIGQHPAFDDPGRRLAAALFGVALGGGVYAAAAVTLGAVSPANLRAALRRGG
ncbi:MAG: murein biosynthesis integral membrane protein MurJ, partial [Rubrimonas sp.]